MKIPPPPPGIPPVPNDSPAAFMRIQPLPQESPSAFRTRQFDAVSAASNYNTLVRFEADLGIEPRPVPKFEFFGTAQHPEFESPLLGPDSARSLLMAEYFSWQAIQDLEKWGRVEPTRVPFGYMLDDWAAPSARTDLTDLVAPIPLQYGTQTLALVAGGGANPERIIGRPGQGTHSFTAAPNNWQSDNAVDIALPKGSPIYAVGAGVISTRFGFGDTNMGGRFAGKRLHLEYSKNVAYYAHLSKIVVQPGQRVRAGDLLGYSGVANGTPHLHFALQRSNPLRIVMNPRRRQPA